MSMNPSEALRAPRNPSTTGPAAAFFDLDGTLIPGSANIALASAAFRAGMVTPAELVRDLRHGMSSVLQGASDEASVRDWALAAVGGRPVADMVALADVVVPDLVESITPAMRTLLEEHGSAGRDRIVLSASPTEVVSRLADAAGLELGEGTSSEIDEDGRCTGRLAGPLSHGEGRAEILRSLAAERGYDLAACYAYSDSLSDLPMLEAVGHPVAVNPEPALREVAEDRRWPIVETARLPRIAVTDAHSWVRMGQRALVAAVGAIAAVGTRPIEDVADLDDPDDELGARDPLDPAGAPLISAQA